ncbi:hypothetical protein GA707_19355 [Nostocoides sp. F2B08]|uniref:hypothetical protein n=1 Tax=Nostocoides sp. F2B08 TaxID=2653936 RepID=UPI001263AEBE|nr:hypothetical protein [Tetrasphaera sp. F2B08]KAB7740317.1 hypothetical protein GA707_19355 [Tetrasphaera sp. F2B08]
MTGAREGPGEAAPEDAPSLSGFVARIFEQLSLSAWLPAAFGTAVVVLLVGFRINESVDVGAVVQDLTNDKWALALFTLPVLILSTLLTQSFAFEAIRMLEGYGAPRSPLNAVRSYGIRKHVERRSRLGVRRDRLAGQAFTPARTKLQALPSVPMAVVAALEAQATRSPVPTLTDAERSLLKDLNWRSSCDEQLLAAVDRHDLLLRDYPPPWEVLPTMLGNIMRTAEINLNTGGDVEGFALRNRHRAPLRVQRQHDQFRTRLDMYCTLVFVSLGLAVLPAPLLAGRNIAWWWIVVFTLALLLFSAVCYRSALSSARGYVVALRLLNRAD